MNTFPSVRSAGPRRFVAPAFTLLELLVVISIIAVLAGILLPVAGSVMETARKTSAKSTVQGIVTAVKAYQSDYGVYPPPYPGLNTTPAATTDTTYKGDQNTALIAILRATDTATTSPNTRRIPYFEAKDVKNANKPKDGIATAATTTTMSGGVGPFTIPVGTLVDPWGVGYMIRYDTGYDDAVMVPQIDGTTPSTAVDSTTATAAGTLRDVLRFGVIAWSYGKDGKPGNAGNPGTYPNYTYGDDVVSWQN